MKIFCFKIKFSTIPSTFHKLFYKSKLDNNSNMEFKQTELSNMFVFSYHSVKNWKNLDAKK